MTERVCAMVSIDAYLVSTAMEGRIGTVSSAAMVVMVVVAVVVVAVRMGRQLTLCLVRSVLIIFCRGMYLQGGPSCSRHEGGDVEIADVQGRPSHTI